MAPKKFLSTLKICDFGSAFDVGTFKHEENQSALFYRAPEQLLGDHPECGPAIDNWSAGLVLWENFSGLLFRNEILKKREN